MAVPNLYRYSPDKQDHEPEETRVTGPLFRKPTLLCCGGLKICKGSALEYRFVHGFAATGAGLLGMEGFSRDGPVDIVSVSYPESEYRLIEDMHAHAKSVRSDDAVKPSSFARAFAQEHLFPLLEDKEGKRLPVAQMKANLSNVRILSHSYGGIFAQQLEVALYHHLHDGGMEQPEIADVLRQVVMVTAGTPSVVGVSDAAFTTLHVLNHDDTEARNSLDFRKAAKYLLYQADQLVNRRGHPAVMSDIEKNEPTYAAKPLTILPVKARSASGGLRYEHAPHSAEHLMYLAQPPIIAPIGTIPDKPSISPYLQRAGADGRFAGDTTFGAETTGHHARTYFYFGRKPQDVQWQHLETHNATMPRLAIASVLINAMNHSLRSPGATPDMDGLLGLPKKIAYNASPVVPYANIARAEHYRPRIEAARSTDHRGINVPQVN